MMKRDLELVLRILKYLDKREEISIIENLHIDGFDDKCVAYHCRRMYEAGLLDAEAITSKTTTTRLIDVLLFGLTWEGHEFLDSMRNKSVVSKVKERLGGNLAEVPFTIIKELALSIGRNQFGL